MTNYKLIYFADEIIDDNYTEESIEALLKEYDSAEEKELTDSEKTELMQAYPDYFNNGALYDMCIGA